MTLTDTELAIAPSIPHSRDAEEAVIGSVLINPLCLYELQFLKPEHFYIHRNGWIWEAFLRLDERRTPIDNITLTEELERRGQLEEVGGAAYITMLISRTVSSLAAVSHGRLIEENWKRRKVIALARDLTQAAYSQTSAVTNMVSSALRDLGRLEADGGEHSFISFGQLLSDTLQEVDIRSKDPKEVWGLATGFPKFDQRTGGLQLSELTYVVGGPGVGKTWLSDSWASELGKQAPGAIISLEMKKTAIGRRMLSGLSGVPTRSMKSGYVKDGDWPKMVSAVEQFSTLPILIDDKSYTSASLRSALSWAQANHGIRWFILDYALLLGDPGEETEKSAVISENLKRIVNDFNLAGIVIHSVVKLGMNEHNEPQMADQRGSGQAIHDADIQLFLTKISERDPSISSLSTETKSKMATLWCSKGRELEQSRFSITLCRRGESPFWGEYDPIHPDIKFRERKDID